MFECSPVRCSAANCSLNLTGKLGERKSALPGWDPLSSPSRAIQKYVNTINKEPRETLLQKSPELLRMRKRKKLQGKARGKVLMRYVSEETLKNPHMILEKLAAQTHETAYKHVGVILNFLSLLFSFEPDGIISPKETRKLTGLLKKKQKDLKRLMKGKIRGLGKFVQNKTIVGKHWDKVISYITSAYHQDLLTKIRKGKLTNDNFLPCLSALSLEIMLMTGVKPKKLGSLERKDLAMTWSQEGLVHIFMKNKLYAIVREDNPDLPPQLDENLWLTKEEHEMLLKLSTFNHNAVRLNTKLAFVTQVGMPINFPAIVHQHLSENIVTCEEMTWNHLHKQLEMVCSYVTSLVSCKALQESHKGHDDGREMKIQEARIMRKTMGVLLKTRTEGRMLEYNGVVAAAFRESEGVECFSSMEETQKCSAVPERCTDSTSQGAERFAHTTEETKVSNCSEKADEVSFIKMSAPVSCASVDAVEPQTSNVNGEASKITRDDTRLPSETAEGNATTDSTVHDSANENLDTSTPSDTTSTQNADCLIGETSMNGTSNPALDSRENSGTLKEATRCRNAGKCVGSRHPTSVSEFLRHLLHVRGAQSCPSDSESSTDGMFCSIETSFYDEEADELEIEGYMEEEDIAHILDNGHV